MPRLMSVSLTEQAVRERRKTVTRRLGWRFLKPGDRLTLCRKVMGRKTGEPLERICDVEVVQVLRQPLSDIRLELDGTRLEGFPTWSPNQFIAFFCEHMKCLPGTVVTRIEWRYLDPVDGPHVDVNGDHHDHDLDSPDHDHEGGDSP